MVKKKKVLKPKPKVVKAKEFNAWGEADKIEKDVLKKGKVKVNKDLEKIW
jgi:hypothetical protein